MINDKTQCNWIIGYPLTHSKSPLLHNSMYRLLNCNAMMKKHGSHDLSSIMHFIKTSSSCLVAVTMPFKKKVVSYLDSMSDEVECIKTANTVICRDGKLTGHNTDIDGIDYVFRSTHLSNKNILCIGAGGASNALGYYLKQKHANLFWLNRTPQHALNLIKTFGGVLADAMMLHQLDIDIIVNATPVGMFPAIHHSPIPDYLFKSNQIIFDMVYNPLETQLMKQAKSQGATCFSGLDMFICQGLKQIELWLDKPIDRSHYIHLMREKIMNANDEVIA